MIELVDLLWGVFLALLLICFYYLCNKYLVDGFTNKKEKVDKIHSWWQLPGDKNYKKYKKDIPGSDVIEYTNIKKIHGSGSLTPEKIESLIL